MPTFCDDSVVACVGDIDKNDERNGICHSQRNGIYHSQRKGICHSQKKRDMPISKERYKSLLPTTSRKY